MVDKPGNQVARNRWLRRVLACIGLVIVLMISVYSAGLPVNRALPEAKTIVVPAGAGVGQIARILTEQRLIRSSLYYRIMAKIQRVDGKLQVGEYNLSQAMPARQILQKMVRGEVATYPVTLPEGYTVQQIAKVLAEKGFADPVKFLAAARDKSITLPFATGKSVLEPLEGYLFPETYYLHKGMTETDIIKLLLRQFREVFRPEWETRAAELGYTVPEIITIASMIEGEARLPAERKVISGVIQNRLRAGMLLQVDATILYLLPESTRVVLYADLEIDSPYNTYIYPGLPPGPIGNPGQEAIEAALYPEDTPYFYYVANKDGSHTFSRTLTEHLRAVSRARGK